jgi:hypothetical protein
MSTADQNKVGVVGRATSTADPVARQVLKGEVSELLGFAWREHVEDDAPVPSELAPVGDSEIKSC